MDVCPDSEYWAVVSGPPEQPRLGGTSLGVAADLHDERERAEWLGALVWTDRRDAERDLQARRDMINLGLREYGIRPDRHEQWLGDFDRQYRVQAIFHPFGTPEREWQPVTRHGAA